MSSTQFSAAASLPPRRALLCALCALCAKHLSSSVVLRESPRSLRLCVIFAPLPYSPCRPSTPCSCPGKPPIRTDRRCVQLQQKLPLQLQLHEFPRSVDYGGLMWDLTPFKINTSKNYCTFCIAFITNHFNSPRINTSKNLPGLCL